MRTSFALAAGSLGLGSLMVACAGKGDPAGTARANGGMTAVAMAAEQRSDDKERSSKVGADSSPFIAGVWKFIPGDAAKPMLDTEFRFINPTDLTVTLEYAFFEQNGTFCGCDRDQFTPNKTTVYTVLGESLVASPCSMPNTPGCPAVPDPNIPPFQFSCKDKQGALRAIVFKNKAQRIFFDDATQVGFQTHAFREIQEFPDVPNNNFNLLLGSSMTEAAMTGVAVSDSTRDEALVLHQQCVTVQGELMP